MILRWGIIKYMIVTGWMLSIPVFGCLAADSLALIRSIPLEARMMAVDETGNVYVVKRGNVLIRYNEKGDSTGEFRSVQNGPVGFVDAVNPLRIVVYYPNYSRVVLLDGMMTPRNDLDLRKMGIFNTPAVASSADGNLWVYDRFNARLRKMDEQLKEVVASNDLRLETETVPDPVFMTERDWKVFMADTTRGIFVLDRYGNYVNTLSIKGVRFLQVMDSKLIFLRHDTLIAWDMNQVTSYSLVLPGGKEEEILQAALVRDVVYILYRDRLALYRHRSITEHPGGNR